jgi:hypothetical protein
MNDKKYILAGLAVLLVIVTVPFWINIGSASKAPVVELTAKAKEAKTCILPKDVMVTDHMQLLDVWRDTVVRKAERIYVNAEGKEFNMSLSNTCLDCHSNKAEFCDRCHTYASADPYCWDCHIDNPKEKE